jgi:hypothetical protein
LEQRDVASKGNCPDAAQALAMERLKGEIDSDFSPGSAEEVRFGMVRFIVVTPWV